MNHETYKQMFKGLGCLPNMHTIKLDPTVQPVVHPPRRVPVSLRERVKSELHRMEQMGVIVKQTEPTEWVNSMVTRVGADYTSTRLHFLWNRNRNRNHIFFRKSNRNRNRNRTFFLACNRYRNRNHLLLHL